jgi:hypothetical protein
MRDPKHGDAFECNDTKAVFTVVGVRRFDSQPLPRYSVVMMCVIGPAGNVRLAGGGPTLGDLHHVGGDMPTLERGYTCLTL